MREKFVTDRPKRVKQYTPPFFFGAGVGIYSVQFYFIYGFCYLHRKEESSFPGNHLDKLRKQCCNWFHYYIFHNCSHNVFHRSQVHSLSSGDTKIEIYSQFYLAMEKGNIFWRKKINRIFLYNECLFEILSYNVCQAFSETKKTTSKHILNKSILDFFFILFIKTNQNHILIYTFDE